MEAFFEKSGYSAESINHYLSAVRAMFTFAEETGLIEKDPKLKHIKNELISKTGSKEKPLYTQEEINTLLQAADLQMKSMILLALNCGFGPKDIHDLTWDDLNNDRVTLPRSKTSVCQTYLLWPETLQLLNEVGQHQSFRISKIADLNSRHNSNGRIFFDPVQHPLEQGRNCWTV